MQSQNSQILTQKSVGNKLALISSIFQASVLVFWTYLLGILSRPTLMIYWFGTAFIILFFYLLLTKKLKFELEKKYYLPIIVFGFLSALTTFLLMTSAQMVGAAITSFVMQTTAIFVLSYSIFALKEKFTYLEFSGILLIIIGLFVLNWKSGISITVSSLIVILAALSQATGDFMAKRLLPKIPRLQLNLMRILCIFLFGAIYLLIIGGSLQSISFYPFLILILGVILGPIFVYVFYYSALEKTNLATANILKGINPIFTLILAFLFLGEIINFQQAISFLIVIVGTYLILRDSRMENKRS